MVFQGKSQAITSLVKTPPKHLFILMALFVVLTGCNQEEFYEKEYLDGLGIEEPTEEVDDSTDDSAGEDNESVSDNDSNGDGSGSGDDSNSGGEGSGSGSGASCDLNLQDQINDAFTQNSAQQGKIDILWVVDDSGSMGDEQDALAYNFDVFINQFVQKDADFQMGITTTDTRDYKRGQLVGNILTRADLDANPEGFKQDFKDFIKVGTDGSGYEKGIWAAQSFLDQHGNSLLRDDAFLIIIYISDEEDQSPETVQYYLDAIRAYKTNGGLLKAYSIVNLTSSGIQHESPGYRYMDFVDNTGGTNSSIKEDFYNSLSDLGGLIVDLLDSFALSEMPEESTLQVYVDGAEQFAGWNYNSSNRTLAFDPGSVPAAGANVEVTYKRACN